MSEETGWRPYMDPGETVLWEGQPSDKAFILGKEDVFFGPFFPFLGRVRDFLECYGLGVGCTGLCIDLGAAVPCCRLLHRDRTVSCCGRSAARHPIRADEQARVHCLPVLGAISPGDADYTDDSACAEAWRPGDR